MTKVLKIVFRKYVAACALSLATLVLAPAAHAASVEIATGMMKGSGLRSDTDLVFPAPGNGMLSPGKLTVRVNDLGQVDTIMDRLASLSFNITNSGSIFAAHDGAGILVVDIATPGFYSLHISATPNANFGLGLLTWSANFEPLAAVPLPASFWLLIAGAAWAIGLQRKRAKLAVDEGGSLLSWCQRTAPAH